MDPLENPRKYYNIHPKHPLFLAIATLQHFRRNLYSNATRKDQIHQLEHSLSHIKQLLYHSGDGLGANEFRLISVALLSGYLCQPPPISRIADLFDQEAGPSLFNLPSGIRELTHLPQHCPLAYWHMQCNPGSVKSESPRHRTVACQTVQS